MPEKSLADLSATRGVALKQVKVRLLVPLFNPSQLVRVFLCLKKLPAISHQPSAVSF